MNAVELFKKHIDECPLCDAKDPTKLCSVGQALLKKVVSDHGKFDAIQKNK